MNRVFADTFYWIAFTNPQDLAHEWARDFARTVEPSTMFTTEEVLTEYLNYFAAWGPIFRRAAAANVESMRVSRTVRIVPQNSSSFDAGLDLYRSRPDKGYGLTDCISMGTMRREGLNAVLTNARHFEQEGFRALFRE